MMGAEVVGLGVTDTAQRTSKKILCTKKDDREPMKNDDSLIENFGGTISIYLSIPITPTLLQISCHPAPMTTSAVVSAAQETMRL